ncbi:MAG: M23 family metallopeptidase [Pseudomonadota bacterium]
MTVLVPLLLLFFIAMPIFYAVRIARLDAPSRAAWLLNVAEATVVCLLILILGRWDIAGMHTRWALAAIFLGAVVHSLYRHRARPWLAPGQPVFRGHRSTLLSLLLLTAALGWITIGLFARHDPVMLAFPLADGRFVVAQGGDNVMLNRHHSHPAQRHALDITAVNAIGVRAAGLLPADPQRYVIFDKPVLSPCSGKVTELRDGLPDLTPPTADPEHPAGNHGVIACGEIEVTLAHLRKGSIQIRTGASVKTGDLIGRVGNSGNTSEPHLHVHAVDSGTGNGVQIGFNNRVPSRNSVFER